MSSKPRGDVKEGRKRALGELDKIFQGPLEGLRIAPEFFKLLGSPELAGTPLSKGLDLQNELLDTVLGGLRGESSKLGAIPDDVRSAVLEAQGSAAAGRGSFGSGAADLGLANEFSGISEQIRSSRIQQALMGLQGTSAAASVLPSSSAFLEVGRQKALTAADIQFRSGLAESEARRAEDAQIGSIIGTIGGGLLGAGLGGFGGLGGMGLGSGFGGAAGGFAAFSGLAPARLFGGSKSPFGKQSEDRNFLAERGAVDQLSSILTSLGLG